jgi:hypothetical protein
MTLTTQSEIEEIVSQQDFPIRLEVYESGSISLFAHNRNIVIDLPAEREYVDKLFKYLKTGENVNPLKTLYLISFPTTETTIGDIHFEKIFGEGVRVQRLAFDANTDYKTLDKWHSSIIEEINTSLDQYFDDKDKFNEELLKDIYESAFRVGEEV